MNKEFKIQFDSDWLRKGDILNSVNEGQLEVIKIYKLVWWKRILLYFGIKTKFFQVKVRRYEGKELELCSSCGKHPAADGLWVCHSCYYDFDGDRRGFWKDEDY